MNEVETSKCRFAADIVPYMYRELSPSETGAFESHLLECNDCTDEFAVISNARFEVYEWKKLDFDTLATPRFVIPYDEVDAKASLIEKVRSLFASSWAIPTVGFAALAGIAIFAATMFLSGENNGVVEVSNSRGGAATIVDSLPPAPVPPTIAKAEAERGDKRVIEDTRRGSAHHIEPRRAVTHDTKPARSIDARAMAVDKKAQKFPTLNEYADDEDNSLRLAELFEDIETRE